MFIHTERPQLVELETKQSPNGKRFYLTPEGNKYPSVTTILGHGEKKWLDDWRNMLGPKKADKETKRCSDRGTAVHTLAEMYLDNKEDFTRGYDKDHIRMFNQLKLRLNKVDNIRIQEAPLYSDQLKIAGRVDCVAEYNGVLSIVDFKTSNNPKDIGMVQDYFLQCTAYALMWTELTGEHIEDIVILMAVEKGMISMVYKDKIDKYVKPLYERIKKFERDQG